MPLALSRQNTGWSFPKTCKQKMASNNAKHVCKFNNAIPLQRGVSTRNPSKMAKIAPPNIKATANKVRCLFMRHHCTNRRSSNVCSWYANPGVSRVNPVNGSRGADRLRRNLEDPKLCSRLVSSESSLISSSMSSSSEDSKIVVTVRRCGPRAPRLSSSAKVGSFATSLLREHRYSKNCFFVTLAAFFPAMRSMRSLTTSELGFKVEHCPNNQHNSSVSITPSLLLSTLSHSSSNLWAKITLSSSSLISRPLAPLL
mmetsp:Transcript_60250/g.173847  ORF Transcript_60250/g.173847 Transcript_60250/m.173847 type:complete len:256 (-) Transcript_60250:1214-1981(-)